MESLCFVSSVAANWLNGGQRDTMVLAHVPVKLRDFAMATISTPQIIPRKTWTVADLYRRFGPIPFERIRQNPPPGSGTVDDVVRLKRP